MPTEPGTAVVAFLGPSLDAGVARSLLPGVQVHPPVEQGSVYAAARHRPRALVIVDGYFGWVPSVWHKEILWALDRGIPVYGAASMGALRAVELEAFGMVGHGRVFESFRSGALTDDDEVAVVHADAALGYRPLSDAMVDIRATLHRAAAEGALHASTAGELVAAMKATHFPDRSFAALVHHARGAGLLDEAGAAALRRWIAERADRVKRADAEGVLRRVAADLDAGRRPAAVGFRFTATTNWVALTALVDAAGTADAPGGSGAAGGHRAETTSVLRECRLAGLWPTVEQAVAARLLLGRDAPPPPGEDDVLTALARWCIPRGIEDLDGVAGWCRDHGMTPAALVRALGDGLRISGLLAAAPADLARGALEVLAAAGRLEALADRARRKDRWAVGADRAAVLAGDPAPAVERFAARTGTPGASDVDLARWHGWELVADLHEDLLWDEQFARAEPGDAEPGRPDPGRAESGHATVRPCSW